MKLYRIASIIAIGSALFAGCAMAYDCSGLPEWKRQAYYLTDTEVQYLGKAYKATENTKRDFPDQGGPWNQLGACNTSGGGGGGSDDDYGDPNPISIYGAWHCGNDYCTWSSVRDMTEFDDNNRWLIDRGDSTECTFTSLNSCNPSVNLVVLSFVHPLKLLHKTNDEQTLNGVPIGMTQAVVDYFKKQGIRVMLSIGGITYVDAWNQALEEDAEQLGKNAAEVAQALGVGIEIDYEENTNPNLAGLQAFINAYRTIHPYCATSTNCAKNPACDSGDNTCKEHAVAAARLTIDLAAGDRWLIGLTRKATADWLKTAENERVLDYANAMVTPRQLTADGNIANWQEHIDGKPQYDPPIPPLAPAKLTGSLWLTGRKPLPECVDFDKSLQKATRDWVEGVTPNGAGTTRGTLGDMFWAAECEGTRTKCTTPAYLNTCEAGMGEAAKTFNIPIPMPALRQE